MTNRTHHPIPTPSTHRRRVVAAVVGVGMAAGGVLVGATAAGASTGAAPGAECVQYETRPDPVTQQPTVVCVRWSRPPGTPVDRDNSDDDEDDGGEQSDCWWEVYPIPEGVVPDRPAGVSDQAVMYWELCLNEFGNTFVGPGGAQWFEPDQAPLPSPAQVATQVRVEVAASLRDPIIATDPPEAQPSIIDVPTFVAVTNWQGEQVVDGCDATNTVCVTITATPALTFAPGEPGATTVECEPGGTRFDPSGPTPEVQAEPDDACVHAYARRTGVGERPDAWTAEATITWDVRWEEQGGGDEGTFADISATAAFDREVDELNTVVVDTD